MLIRQFAYGFLLTRRQFTIPVCILVERLQTYIDVMGVWGNAAGLSFITGLPIAAVEDIIMEGKKYV